MALGQTYALLEQRLDLRGTLNHDPIGRGFAREFDASFSGTPASSNAASIAEKSR